MEEKNKTTIWIIVGLIVLAILGYFVYQSLKSPAEEPSTFVSNFKECALAGFPVSEGNPRECRTTNGSTYKEETKNTGDSTAVATGGCFIGGCSSQICSDQPDAVSTCEYRSEYGCYKSARCERQTNGSCGWTQTSTLTQCLKLDFDLNNLSK
jgi:hypothetical protein